MYYEKISNNTSMKKESESTKDPLQTRWLILENLIFW